MKKLFLKINLGLICMLFLFPFNVTKAYEFTDVNNQSVNYYFNDAVYDLKSLKFNSTNRTSGVGKLAVIDKYNNKIYSGTYFVIDKNTVITNKHALYDFNKQFSMPKLNNIRLYHKLNNNGGYFKVKSIKLIPGKDIAILKSTVNLSSLKVAKNLPQKGEKIKSIGYPKNGNLIIPYKSEGYYIGSINGISVIQNYFRSGMSGGPLLNSKDEVIGVTTFGTNTLGNQNNSWSNKELSGAYIFTQQEMKKYIY